MNKKNSVLLAFCLITTSVFPSVALGNVQRVGLVISRSYGKHDFNIYLTNEESAIVTWECYQQYLNSRSPPEVVSVNYGPGQLIAAPTAWNSCTAVGGTIFRNRIRTYETICVDKGKPAPALLLVGQSVGTFTWNGDKDLVMEVYNDQVVYDQTPPLFVITLKSGQALTDFWFGSNQKINLRSGPTGVLSYSKEELPVANPK